MSSVVLFAMPQNWHGMYEVPTVQNVLTSIFFPPFLPGHPDLRSYSQGLDEECGKFIPIRYHQYLVKWEYRDYPDFFRSEFRKIADHPRQLSTNPQIGHKAPKHLCLRPAVSPDVSCLR